MHPLFIVLFKRHWILHKGQLQTAMMGIRSLFVDVLASRRGSNYPIWGFIIMSYIVSTFVLDAPCVVMAGGDGKQILKEGRCDVHGLLLITTQLRRSVMISYMSYLWVCEDEPRV